MLKKSMLVFGVIIILCGMAYGLLVLLSRKKYPTEFGITFNQTHADFLGLEWKQMYTSVLDELHPKFVRVSAMWSEIEPTKGTYTFQDLDWIMDESHKRGTRVTLVVGQKAPRWPECHVPAWINGISDEEYEQKLMAYVRTVVERYKDHGALEIWQVENEPFIKFRFGECKRFREDLVKPEITLVRELDLAHRIMVTDSGELSLWWKASKLGDVFGTTMYRIVRTPGGKIWTYDWLPAAFYRMRARLLGISQENFYIAELQGEPWFTNGSPTSTSMFVQEQTMNPERLKKHLDFAMRVHSPRVYLWGVEWWYWMKEKQDNDAYWKLIQSAIDQSTQTLSNSET